MSLPEIHHIHLAETASTNSYARELPSDSGTLLITADHQTAGRGQRGSTWESAAGYNLLFSLVVHPEEIPASLQFSLCELISVALCEVLARYVTDIRIKWPNDIYHKDKKLCGILIEHDIEGTHLSRSIIGVGLNVNQTEFTSDAPNPISLRQILGREVEREALLETIATRFMELYTQHTSPTPTLSRTALHERYVRLLYRRDQHAPYRDVCGPFTATLRTVAPDGRLLLEDTQGQQRSYLFKEVEFVLVEE